MFITFFFLNLNIINLNISKMKPPKSYLENPNTIKANKELVKVLNKMFGKKK